MFRKCVKCGEEKELEKFRKRNIWFSHTCKKCYSAQYNTGKPNTGRFVKGQKGTYFKGKTPRHLVKVKVPKIREIKSEHPYGGKRAQWGLDIKTRDGFKCQKCGTEENVHAHHIIPWKHDKSKRFELDNGITLCCSCHSRTERLLELANGKNNLKGDK
jgi:hypothetical protein